MNWIKNNVSNLVLLSVIVTALWQFSSMKEVGAATQQKMLKHDSTFVAVQKIAISLEKLSRDPNKWLKDYLLNHGVDTTQAGIWSRMQKGSIPDSTGKPIGAIPFLQKEYLPENGILQIYIGDSLMTMQTLWKFPRKKE